jgi:hypothetical protein
MIETVDNYKICARLNVERVNSQIINELFKIISENIDFEEIRILPKKICIE